MSGTSTTAPYAGQRLSRDDVLRIMAESRANLSSADLRFADLRSANLRFADLRSANLRFADLRFANLRSADLRFADLRSADLSSADLGFADLSSADLGFADLSSADLRFADLRSANLRSADLSFADLRSANLRSANLRSADLRSADLSFADLRSANLRSTSCLSVTGLPSGHAILAPLPAGWRLTVGCWSGTVEALRDLIAGDDGWPEAEGDQITARRPMLAALADMCDAWIADNTHILAHVQAEWTPEGERRWTSRRAASTRGAEGGDR